MRYYFSLFAAMICAYFSFAQTKQKVNIEQATVFLSGAELFSTAKVNLPQGESEILFTNIAGNVNQQSLTIGADNQVAVQSAVFQHNYLQENISSPAVKALEDSLDNLNEIFAGLNTKLTIVNEQLSVLSENKKISGQNSGLSVAELQKMIDLIGAKMGSFLQDKNKIAKEQTKLTEKITQIKQQIEEEKSKGFQPGGQLLVKFYTPKTTTTNIKLSYVVPNAGWQPTYDIRVEDLSKPVKLFYKANVYQNCGVKWDNVHLTLSTGNPTEGANAPELQPWRLSFYMPVQNYGYMNTKQATAPGTISIAGARSNGTVYVVDGVQVNAATKEATMDDYVSVDNSGVNTSFDIDLPYTISSDGKQQLVAIKTYDLPASYRYYAAPKLDHDAFLQAQITNWEDLNLLPASTNIFYEGSYVGQGYVDMRNVHDTMNISLGRDKKVVIRREMDKKLRSVKTIGSNVRESMTFIISVRNTRKEKLSISLYDQFPLSNDKDIEIEDREAKDAIIDETTGQVKWTLSMEPNELKELRIAYTVKYPKGKTLNNFR
jgi:uncharacterized protein (TIGR02231 family)